MPRKELRGVYRDARFEEECKAIHPNVRRIDEMLDGVIDAITRNPQIGRKTSAPDILGIPTMQWPDAPAAVIYYSYDEKNVTLKSIKLVVDFGEDADELEFMEEGEPGGDNPVNS